MGSESSWYNRERRLPPPIACELVRLIPQIASKVKDVPQVPPLPAEQARQALLEAAQQAPLLVGVAALHGMVVHFDYVRALGKG